MHRQAALAQDKGDVSFDSGLFQDAVTFYSEALSLDPSIPRVFFKRGLAQSRLNRDAEAIVDFSTAIRMSQPRVPVVYYQCRARSHSQLYQHDKAVEDLSLVIGGVPSPHARHYDSRGHSYRKMRNFEAAMADFDEALRLKPSHTGAYQGRALIYMRQDLHQKAIDDLTLAIDISEKESRPWIGFYLCRSQSYDYAHEHELALEDFLEGLVCDNRMADRKGLEHFSVQIQNSPEPSVGNYCICGMFHERMNEGKEAIQCYEQALQIKPLWDSLRWAVARLRSYEDERERVEFLLRDLGAGMMCRRIVGTSAILRCFRWMW